jgi:hypothetical protein
MSTSSSSALRWALRLSLLAAGVAVVLSLQPDLLPGAVFGDNHGGEVGGDGAVQTYCYQSVRTGAILDDDDNGPRPNCFSVSAEGKFTRVLSSSDLGSSQGEVELRKGHVLPGLWDGHGHLIAYGEFLHSADLFGAGSPDEVRRRLRKYLAANPGVGTKEVWARGIGWDQMTMGGMPFAAGIPYLLLVDCEH